MISIRNLLILACPCTNLFIYLLFLYIVHLCSLRPMIVWTIKLLFIMIYLNFLACVELITILFFLVFTIKIDFVYYEFHHQKRVKKKKKKQSSFKTWFLKIKCLAIIDINNINRPTHQRRKKKKNNKPKFNTNEMDLS